MYGIIFDSLDRFYSQALEGLQTYTDILRKHTEEQVINTLQQELWKKSHDKAEVIPFQRRKSHTYLHHEDHAVVYYDFPHHHTTSEINWYKEWSHEFLKHAQEISEDIMRESKQIHQAFMRYHYRYFWYIDTYLSHLRNPLFQNSHYTQFCKKHIWVQKKEDNIVYAFSFSPEETHIYKEMNTMHSQWEKEKNLLIQGFTRLIWSIDHLWTIHEKVRLFGPKDITNIDILETQRKEIREEVTRFIDLVNLFHIEDYLTFDTEHLLTVHAWVKNQLPKRKQNIHSLSKKL
jgi:hypothetical protein